MNIACVALQPEDINVLTSFINDSEIPPSPTICWRVEGKYHLAEQLLAPLEEAFRQTPVAVILFPQGDVADELATRLAWRLHGVAICRATAYYAAEGTVLKTVYGSALTAKMSVTASPLCLSLARSRRNVCAHFPGIKEETLIKPIPLRPTLSSPVNVVVERPLLNSADRVLASGGGAVGINTPRFARILGAEEGYSRQRVMAGGCDEQRMLGISGQQIAPSLCIVVGASGASAFMAGISGSGFIVAINQDATAPIFAAADVGVTGDAADILEALIAEIN